MPYRMCTGSNGRGEVDFHKLRQYNSIFWGGTFTHKLAPDVAQGLCMHVPVSEMVEMERDGP